MKTFKGFMSKAEVSLHLICGSRLIHDWKGFWRLRWPQTRWTTCKVIAVLEKHGHCKVTKRSVKDGHAMEIYIHKHVTIEIVETLCLGEKGIKDVDWFKAI
jgi:hypothetical protein